MNNPNLNKLEAILVANKEVEYISILQEHSCWSIWCFRFVVSKITSLLSFPCPCCEKCLVYVNWCFQYEDNSEFEIYELNIDYTDWAYQNIIY